MKIVMNSSTIESLGNKVLSCSKTFENDTKKINSLIDSINSAWEGNDSLKYINTLKNKMEPVLKELSEEMNKYGLYLKNVPNTFDILDDEYASKEIEV